MRELVFTKTFWVGVGTVCYGVMLLLDGQTREGTEAVLAGLGLIFLRDAVRKGG